MRTAVLDASALVAFLLDEPGAEVVEQALHDAETPLLLSTVNLTEVLQQVGPDLPDVVGGADALVQIVPFGAEHARDAAELHPSTRPAGLSLGDRACLALARTRGSFVLTADRAWESVDVGVEVRLIR